MLIENLCTQVGDLRALAISRADDAASYRHLARQALTALHDEQVARNKLQARYDRLVAEYREHRARVLADVGVRAA